MSGVVLVCGNRLGKSAWSREVMRELVNSGVSVIRLSPDAPTGGVKAELITYDELRVLEANEVEIGHIESFRIIESPVLIEPMQKSKKARKGPQPRGRWWER